MPRKEFACLLFVVILAFVAGAMMTESIIDRHWARDCKEKGYHIFKEIVFECKRKT